jgi:hypothetical protein
LGETFPTAEARAHRGRVAGPETGNPN